MGVSHQFELNDIIMRFLVLLSLLVAGASAATTGCGAAEPVECPSETHKYCAGRTDPETGCQESGWCLDCSWGGLDSPSCYCEPDFCVEPEQVNCPAETHKFCVGPTNPETGCQESGWCLDCSWDGLDSPSCYCEPDFSEGTGPSATGSA